MCLKFMLILRTLFNVDVMQMSFNNHEQIISFKRDFTGIFGIFYSINKSLTNPEPRLLKTYEEENKNVP